MVHHVALAGGPAVGAGCAIDALGIRVMLGSPVAITSRDQGRGQDVTVRVDGAFPGGARRTQVHAGGRKLAGQ